MSARQVFSIHHTSEGACSVQQVGFRKATQFSDIQQALWFVRDQRRGKPGAKVSFYDFDGELLFTEEF